MDLNDTPEQAKYRAGVREWLEQHKAAAPPRSGSYEDTDLMTPRQVLRLRPPPDVVIYE